MEELGLRDHAAGVMDIEKERVCEEMWEEVDCLFFYATEF